ncbi:MAG: NTP transferase domain-containing protein [Thermoanaerobacterales bacterium]|nr:NTP transferase domain-containing protein [Thermoanaerobacterales bacterium]
MKQFDTAIIIAGGKSTRMGFDKAFMRIGNSYCIELLIRKLKKNFNEIIIVTENSKKHDFMNDAITDFMNVTITSDIIEIIPFDKLKKICKSLSLFTNLNTRQELNRFIKEVDYTG